MLPHRSAPLRREAAGYAVTLLPALPYDVTYTSDHHVIGFTFGRQEGVDAFASDRRRPFRAEPWRLAFTPAGCEVFSASSKGGEYMVLSVTPERLERLGPGLDRARLPQFTNLADPRFTPLAMALRRAVCAGEAMEGLGIEVIATAAAERVAAQMDKRTATVGAARGMTPWRMRRVLEYLEVHLEKDVRLADIARLVDVSEAYLARAFKAATGTTLHAALVELRIARAWWLMNDARRRRAELRLADIAAQSGFSSHAHLTTAFRRVLGTTPSQWKRMLTGDGAISRIP